MAKVSIIVNCFNGEKYLREAIDSVYAQTYKDWEIILWDDASTDKTEEIAKSYDKKIKFFKGKKAIALGQARNWAIEKAGGEYIAFLDQDDIWLPLKLEKQMPFFNDSEVGLVYSDTIFFDNKGFQQRLLRSRRIYTGRCFEKIVENYRLAIETVVIRRKALDTIDMWFDNSLSLAEDKDLFIRIAFNWKIAAVKEPLAKCRIHPENWTKTLMEIAPQELQIVLENLRKAYPDFDRRYPNSLLALKRDIALWEAKISLGRNNKSEARKYLLLHLKNTHALRLYLITFLPKILIPFTTALFSKINYSLIDGVKIKSFLKNMGKLLVTYLTPLVCYNMRLLDVFNCKAKFALSASGMS